MDNFQSNTVKRLVQFMYTGKYDDPEDQDEVADQDLSGDLEIGTGRQLILIVWRLRG